MICNFDITGSLRACAYTFFFADLRKFRYRNVIVVDWTYLATWDYFKASRGNVYYVAEVVQNLIQDLMTITVPFDERAYFLSRQLLIGHSLGAHIMGRVGRLFNRQIGMIVGLDPAGPLFAPYKNDRHCLTRADAKQVIVLHTSSTGMGTRYVLGTKDFYANGGAKQPELWRSASSLSHKRATNIFRASIYRPKYAIGFYCPIPMYKCGPELTKIYYFDIDDEDPDILDAPIFLPTTGTQPFFNRNLKINFVPPYKSERVKDWNVINYLI